jgi:hypothetical protein
MPAPIENYIPKKGFRIIQEEGGAADNHPKRAA